MSSQTGTPTLSTGSASPWARSEPARADRLVRVLAVALGLSGFCFLLYPAIRPFSDETSLAGARAFASPDWVVAHTFGIAGFVLLGLGMYGLSLRLQSDRTAGRTRWATALTWIGVGLTLPYYGAEVFGLHAVGRAALDRGDANLLDTLTHSIRWEAGIWFILTGLVVLAVGVCLAASAVWSARQPAGRWTAVPLAVAVCLYIPQFAAPQPMRVIHGGLMAVGCWWLAIAVLRAGGGAGQEPRR
jgi:hypothetical protein